jgi:hypothetical protein
MQPRQPYLYIIQLALVNSNDLRRSIKAACQRMLFKGTLTERGGQINPHLDKVENLLPVLNISRSVHCRHFWKLKELEGPTSNTETMSSTVEISPEDFNVVCRQRDHPRLETVSLHAPMLRLIPWGPVHVCDTAVGRVLYKVHENQFLTEKYRVCCQNRHDSPR